MPTPRGTLTAAQFEIMQVIWDAAAATPPAPALTVADIWERLQQRRTLGRTTVLNQVNRLAARGWLRRSTAGGAVRFAAAVPRDDALASLTRAFTQDYFAGSAGLLFQSLLGSADISTEDLSTLRQIIANAQKQKPHEKEKP